MANIAKKFTRTVKKATRKVTKFASEAVNSTKYSIQIKAKGGDLEEKYEELGRLCYKRTKEDSEQLETLYNKCLEEIEVLNQEILELRRKLAHQRAEVVCPSCGIYVASSREVCPSCNAPLTRMEVDAPSSSDGDEENE